MATWAQLLDCGQVIDQTRHLAVLESFLRPAMEPRPCAPAWNVARRSAAVTVRCHTHFCVSCCRRSPQLCCKPLHPHADQKTAPAVRLRI